MTWYAHDIISHHQQRARNRTENILLRNSCPYVHCTLYIVHCTLYNVPTIHGHATQGITSLQHDDQRGQPCASPPLPHTQLAHPPPSLAFIYYSRATCYVQRMRATRGDMADYVRRRQG